jgi:hydrogenase-4 membrane subunit HyfE
MKSRWLQILTAPVQRRFATWLERRMPAVSTLVLEQRTIFILPAPSGIYFFAMGLVVLIGAAFWLSSQLPLSDHGTPTLLVPAALSTLLIGLLALTIRRGVLSQGIGYLIMENGIFAFGVGLSTMPVVVEFGLFFDLLVCTLLFGTVVRTLNSLPNPVDTGPLSE